jgi:hypothetical protein
MPVIPGTWEEEMGGLKFECSQPGQKDSETLSQNKIK